MTDQFKTLLRETAKWFLRVALVLLGFPVILLALIILLGLLHIDLPQGLETLVLYTRIPCLVLGSAHLENKFLLPRTGAGFLFIFLFYIFVAFCIGFLTALVRTKRETIAANKRLQATRLPERQARA